MEKRSQPNGGNSRSVRFPQNYEHISGVTSSWPQSAGITSLWIQLPLLSCHSFSLSLSLSIFSLTFHSFRFLSFLSAFVSLHFLSNLPFFSLPLLSSYSSCLNLSIFSNLPFFSFLLSLYLKFLSLVGFLFVTLSPVFRSLPASL